MFNLSTAGNAGYNGISQLSESRCTPQYNDVERTATATKMRFANATGRSKYTTGFKMPLYADVKNVSPDSRLKLSNSKEDVYTFNDVDTPVVACRTPNSFLKESVASDKTDSVCTKKTLAGSLLTSPKKVQIGKHVNGFSLWKDISKSELKNGIHKPVNSGESSKSFQNNSLPSRKCATKQNKSSIESASFHQNNKSEQDSINCNPQTDGLNNSSKSSIISYNNYVPNKSVLVCQDKKTSDPVKKESLLKATNGSFNATSTSSCKNIIKIPPKKIAGKSLSVTSKTQKGRGPALHEALQRINPSISSLPPKNILSKVKWHAPESDLFDCGILSTTSTKFDSDSSEDFGNELFDYDSDGSNEYSDRSDLIAKTRTKLRRKITLLHQLKKISEYSKSASSLYNSVKSQMRKQRKTLLTGGFRLESPALDILLASQGTSSVLSAADKKRIKYSSRVIEPVQCTQPGCASPALACARLCLAHISLDPEQRLFSECTAKFSDNTQCRVPVLDFRNELPLCSEHMLKKEIHIRRNTESKPKKAARKRPKSSSIRPSKRNRKKTPSLNMCEDDPSVKSDLNEKFLKLKDDVNLFSSSAIENDITPNFLNHDDTAELNVCSNSSACESSEDTGIGGLSENELIAPSADNQHIVDADVVAEVLALHESGDLPQLDLPAVTGPPQDPNIDLSTVFNDIFTEQNGEYIPTREETEELERALEAVNQDVKSLEKLANSEHTSLLDTLLDEKALAETLANFPDVFSNIQPVKVSIGDSADLPS